MSMKRGLALVRRHYGWLIVLGLLPLLALLAAVAVAYAQGLRVQGLSWQNGLELAQWQRLHKGCVQALGGQLRVTGWRPLTISMRSLNLPKCETGTEELTPPPWTPPFDLTIDSLTVPGLPPVTAVVRQREQRWHIQAKYRHSAGTAVYDRLSGRWSAQGLIQPADIAPKLLGALTFSGQGIWQDKRLDGVFLAQGHQLGYAGQPQRADAAITASFAAKRWQLEAMLDAPVTLGHGWSLEARQGLRASGNLAGVESLRLGLLAAGPQGLARLTVDTEGGGVARGQGRLVLDGPSLSGTVPLRWNRQALELLPAAIRLPEGVRLSWPRPLLLPLATSGQSRLSAELQYQGLRLKTVDSQLSWQQALWDWQGRLELTGKAAGFDLTGVWRGRADAAGPAGDPASLTVKGPDLQMVLKVPVTGLQRADKSTRVEFNGRYGRIPVAGTLEAGYRQGRWEGAVEGRAQPPFYARGGGVQMAATWYGKEGRWLLGPDSRITLAEGLIGTTVIKPITMITSTPLEIGPQGAFGSLQVKADGAVVTRGALPALSGQLDLAGRQGRARLQVPAWKSELGLTAALARHGKSTGATGTVELTTPLSAAMSRSLGVTLQKGILTGRGQWQWQDRWQLKGDVTVSDLALDWGGILASGGKGTVHVELQPDGLALASVGPVTLGELALGTPLRDIRMTVQSDLSTWRLADVYAEVLGGQMRADTLQWPSAQYQAITVGRLDLTEVAALQNDPNPTVQLAGRVGGTLPVQLAKDSLALQGGLLRNEGPLSLKVLPSAGVSAMGQSNRAMQLTLDTLSSLNIHDFQARLDMAPDGWMDAAVTIKGQNPERNGLPVVLNYTHRENVLELLRSLRIADEISRKVLEREPENGPR
ncbi:YdbH domain-containing protein [Pseudogulbenkiania sp. MAI-1]|uniref:intermembrane phospholipid transport protein YdbH family protein n=1 Tax=Pseudogulbenkiania sp. MAI-1 TaxID=990370 RepID=UPI00045E91EB|nr:YdbH domain-containing protein [Pseudogulbenkiania sp. MAI-1]